VKHLFLNTHDLRVAETAVIRNAGARGTKVRDREGRNC
jgi:hypothetical protein